MFGFSAKEMGIDLGTANTLIYIKDKGMVLNEASCIAYDKRNAEVIATGAKAKAMYGKAPKDIVVVKPLQDGVISDFDMAAEMLQRFIRTAMGKRSHPACGSSSVYQAVSPRWKSWRLKRL